MGPRTTLLCALALAGCAPPDDLGPQVVRVIARVAGEYQLADERLSTLESARRVRGGAAELRGGGSVLVEEELLSSDVASESQDDVQQSTLVKGDGPVAADYGRDGDTLVPLDWESLVMFSFYRDVERAVAFYEDVGVDPAIAWTFVSQFYVRVTALVAWGSPLVNDNAAYAPVADCLLLFPAQVLESGVPLVANEGVIAHELSHALKHRRIHGHSLDPIYSREHWPAPAIDSYRADDEGLADFFAAVYTGDPDFIAPSLPGLVVDRDLSRRRSFTDLLAAEVERQSVAAYDPYPLGSALASWLWETAGDDLASRLALARAAVLAIGDLADGGLDAGYRVTRLIDAVMARASPELHDRGCALLAEPGRLAAPFRDVPSCGISP